MAEKHAKDEKKSIDAVVIGASAGGVEAIGILLAALPARFSLPVVIVLHLPETHDSLLPEVFGHHCALPVKEVEDKEPLAPGTVYVAAPGYHVLVEPDKSLSLAADEPVNFSRPSIDLLFESAAHAYRDRLLGIILTGANHDGAAGLARIRAYGGSGWVQDPGQAQASAMPSAAIAQAGADLVLPTSELAVCLAQLGTPVSF